MIGSKLVLLICGYTFTFFLGCNYGDFFSYRLFKNAFQIGEMGMVTLTGFLEMQGQIHKYLELRNDFIKMLNYVICIFRDVICKSADFITSELHQCNRG